MTHMSSISPRPTKRCRNEDDRRTATAPERPAILRRQLEALPVQSIGVRCANACIRCKSKKLKCRLPAGGDSTCSACTKAAASCKFVEASQKQAQIHAYVLALETRVAKLEKALGGLDPKHPEIVDHWPATASNGSNTPGTLSPRLVNDRLIAMDSIQPRAQYHSIASIIQPLSAPMESFINTSPQLPPLAIADEIVETVYCHVQARYPFMEWDRVRKWHRNRDECVVADEIGSFFLWAVYAVGAQLAPHPQLDTAETYFAQAMRHVDSVLQPHDITTIRGMLLLLFLSFRSSEGPPLWSLCGFTMRLCLELYLHRVDCAVSAFETENRKRVFWSAYAFDRLVCLASGRPFSIADVDIEISLPVDIDEASRDSVAISLLQSEDTHAYARTGQITTMSSAIHTIRQYQLRSRIYTTIYAARAVPASHDTITSILTDLADWRSAIPKANKALAPVQHEDKFEMMYSQIVLFTLRRAVITAESGDPLLSLCATSAVESCEKARRVHETVGAKHTICSLCHVFTSGVTLLHCLSVDSTVISTRTSSRALRSCSSSLAMYAQLFRDAVPFRELFEFFTDEVIGGSLDSHSGVPTTEVLKQVMMGEFGQLGSIYERLSDATTLPNQSQKLTNTEAITPPQTINCDFNSINMFVGELGSMLNIALDSPPGAWQEFVS